MRSSPAFQRLLEKIGVPIERKTVSPEGLTTHYLKAGEGNPLLLVHVGGVGAIQWGPIIGPLARHLQIIAPDVVGYGESDKPNAPYDRSYLAGWLAQFVRALQLNRCHLLAVSQA